MRRWLDKKAIPFQHKLGDHTFDLVLEFKNQDHNGVYECYVAIPGGGTTKMSVKEFEKEDLLRRMKEPVIHRYHFVPSTSFVKENSFFGIGDYLGEPLSTWITKLSPTNRWKLNSKLEVEQFGPYSFPIVRKVAEILNNHHKKTRALGLRINEMYIKGDSFKLLNDHCHSSALDVRSEMIIDLEQFKRLVRDIVGSNHTNDPNMELFNALFPSSAEFSTKTSDEIKWISYIICHSPFFWGMNERIKFANAYDQMRYEYRKTDFDNVVQLNQGIFEIVDWWRNLPANPAHPIRQCYDYLRYRMKRSHLLMTFIRNCHQHYYEKKNPRLYTDLDEELLNLFPYAFGKVYGVIYLRINMLANMSIKSMTLSELINILKKQGLDYGE